MRANHARLISTPGHVYVDNDIVHHLLSGAEPLFPNLTRLDISLLEFDTPAVYPQLLIGTILRDLYVDYDPDEVHTVAPFSVWSNIARILPIATHLHSLRFSSDIRTDYQSPLNAMRLLLPSLRASDSLVELAVPSDFDLVTLQHFAMTRSLVQLEFAVPSAIIHQFLSATSLSTHIFENLEQLEVETDNLGALQSLLELDGFGSLQGLCIHHNDPSIPYDLCHLFTSLLRNDRITQIEEVVVDNVDPTGPPTHRLSGSYSLFPLCQLPNLTTVHVDMHGSISLDDTILNAMVDAWPHLKRLQLYDWSDPTLPVSSFITPDGMLSLAKCRYLTSLALRVNACGPLPDLSMISYPKYGEKLTTFCLCRSPGLHPMRLTGFLRVLFPNLRNLSYGYQRGHRLFASIGNLGLLEQEYFECWREVWRLITDGTF
jgi:hypothetical protein